MRRLSLAGACKSIAVVRVWCVHSAVRASKALPEGRCVGLRERERHAGTPRAGDTKIQHRYLFIKIIIL